MRIGLVIEEFDPCRGGVEQWTWQAAEQLARRGHEVHVVARRFGDAAAAMPIVAHPLGRVGERVAFAEAASRQLRSLSLDVVHDTGCGFDCDVFQPHGGSRFAAAAQNLLLLPPSMRGIKRAVSRLLPRYRQFCALSARQYADDGRAVLALSRRVAADLTRLHGVRPERIRLIYNGVDTERFSPSHREKFRNPIREQLGISDESVLLLIVAHNFRLKGVPMLIEAVARWPHDVPVNLVVVGGKHVRRFERITRRRGLADRIRFVGAVENTVPYYAAADVYVHPTFYDPCSLVVLEALACGLPVVTSRQNGVSELMVDGREGALLDDPADLAEFWRRMKLLLNGKNRERMGNAARQLALKHPFERNIDELLEVYEEACQSRRRAEEEMLARLMQPFECRIRGESPKTPPRRCPSHDTGVLS